MKKTQIINFLLISLITLSIYSCKKKDKCEDVTCPSGYVCDDGACIVDIDAPTETDVIVKSGFINSNETWVASNIYELAGKVVVSDGATLTIEPGTIIKGRQGTGSLSSALVVAQGGKLMAEGTAAQPIIFTSVLDNIKVGEKTGTNLDENDNSKWGGLIILGNAKISSKIGDTSAQIEGIPADESYGIYGGTDDTDNSGSLAYVSIRHGGTLIGEGNEINGLTLGGVGTGTSIHHIEIVANLDDGVECFGGTVNLSEILVSYQGDDGLDIDQNYAGTISNSMVIYNNNGDEFMEIDGPENSTYSTGKFTVTNCSFKSMTNDGTVDLKSKAQGTITNCSFEGLDKFKVSASWTENCTLVKTDAYDNLISSDLVIEDNTTGATILVYTNSEDETIPAACPIPDSYQTDTEGIYSSGNNSTTVSGGGASQDEFTGWTWTEINGKF